MRLGSGIISAVLILSLTGCAGSSLHLGDALAEVPYQVVNDGRIIIDVEVVNDGPFRFALDTGASISIVFDDLRDKLKLEPDQGESVLIHGMVASGSYPLLNVSHLRVGGVTWVAPRVASLPGNTSATADLDGILGIDFLQRYAVGFEAGDRVLRLYAPSLVDERAYRGWASIPLDRVSVSQSSAALYLIELQIGGEAVPALFDLGAGFNMLNWAAARSLNLEATDPGSRGSISGSLEDTPVLARFVASEMSIGGLRWRDEVFLVGDLDIFSRLKRADSPFVIVGSGLFSRHDFVLDFVRNRLLVKLRSNVANNPR